MGQITRDGITFSSEWIDVSVARFNDKRISWAIRRHQLEWEIGIRESDLKLMLQTMPNDHAGHAHSREHLDALRRTQDDLNTEIVSQR